MLVAGLILSNILTGCGTVTPLENSVTETVEPNVYATYIQKNNRTVRVKNFAEVLVDPNTSVPTDEYIKFGLFYDAYATPDEITRYEFIFDESQLVQSLPVSECLKYIYFYELMGSEELFEHCVLETTLSNYTVEGYVSGGSSKLYPNLQTFSFRTPDGFMLAVLTQTSEDLAKGDNVWSMYVGVNSLREE